MRDYRIRARMPIFENLRNTNSVLEERRRKDGGFSLLELLVTIAIGALVLSVGVPGLTSFTKNSNILASSNTLLADMHYARDLAVTRNQRTIICPSNSGLGCDISDWAAGWIVFVDDNNNRQYDAGEAIERVGEGLSGLSVQPFRFTDSLTYRPSGRAMGATVRDNFGAFLICDDRGADYARAVIVDISGRPRVSHLAEMGISAPCPTS